ncbi:MAG: LacI family DNA-binding transcriptional regulator [Fimbriimonadaceae bacterium]
MADQPDLPRAARTNGSTLKEVADAAGVSVASASKVLHGRGSTIRVGAERAATIRAAAERLHYSPNALARQLRSSRTYTIGLVWEHMRSIADGPLYYVNLLDGVAKQLFANHYRLTILPELPTVQPVRALSDGRLDGVIWCKMPHDEAVLNELEHTTLRVVALNSPPPREEHGVPFIHCDNEAGAELVIDHLAALGHRRILFVLDHGWENTPDAHARLAGYRLAMRRRGLPCAEDDVAVWSITEPPVAEWLHTNPEHTAIFAWHEGLAGRILATAHAAGIQVPYAFSLVGFDSTMYCESTKPRLTAVRQPVREMAESAAQLLIDLVEGRASSATSRCFPCSLDVRDSTSPPAHLSPRPLNEEAPS